MTKKEIIKAVAEKSNFTQKDVGAIFDYVVDEIKSSLIGGEKVSIPKFGTFEVALRAEREGRNPQTGETMTIAACKRPKFKPSQSLKDEVNE